MADNINMSREGMESATGGDSHNQRDSSLTTYYNAYEDIFGAGKKKEVKQQGKK